MYILYILYSQCTLLRINRIVDEVDKDFGGGGCRQVLPHVALDHQNSPLVLLHGTIAHGDYNFVKPEDIMFVLTKC